MTPPISSEDILLLFSQVTFIFLYREALASSQTALRIVSPVTDVSGPPASRRFAMKSREAVRLHTPHGNNVKG